MYVSSGSIRLKGRLREKGKEKTKNNRKPIKSTLRKLIFNAYFHSWITYYFIEIAKTKKSTLDGSGST